MSLTKKFWWWEIASPPLQPILHDGWSLAPIGLAARFNEMKCCHHSSSSELSAVVAGMACDMLGVDPYHLANEGCMVLFVDSGAADSALAMLRSSPYGRHAQMVGRVVEQVGDPVSECSIDGHSYVVRSLSGRVLPRLC